MNNHRYPHLFSPIQIGSLTARNRIEAAPVGMSDLTPEGYLTRENIAAYEAKARGGAAIVALGESNVHTKTGKAHGRMVPLDDEEVLPSLIKTTDAIRRHGALASIELLHPGRRANPYYFDGDTYGPTGGPGLFGKPVVELSEEMILEIVHAFGDAAEMAKLGGVDMCMVHAGHGWLVHQFLSPLNNQRTDRFGGSLENRARFALMVAEDIRRKCGADFPIEFRVSGSELAPGGYDLEDMVEVVRMLDGKVDLINVSSGTFHVPSTNTSMVPSMFVPRGEKIHLAETLKKAVKKTKISALGGLGDLHMMERIIAEGKADMVALGRALIADPDLPRKAWSGECRDITPCQRCIVCMSDSFVPYVKYPTRITRCTVNPRVSREYEYFQVPPVEKPKRILIAGGGPGGMQAAITAADRGHEVFLCEKTASLGGMLHCAGHVSFKKDLRHFLDVLVRRVERRKITVLYDTPVTEALVREIDPEVFVAAVGGTPIMPDIPGIRGEGVFSAVDIPKMEGRMGSRVVFIGGGLVGCEEGLEMAMKGKAVTILEMREAPALGAAYLHREALLLEMKKYGDTLSLVTDTRCLEITPRGVRGMDKEGKEKFFEGDTVVIAAGLHSLADEIHGLRHLVPDFLAIGDCRKPRRVLEAVREGYDAAMHM